MANIQHKLPDLTVANIAALQAITKKIDHMTVTVTDAIADVNAGPGIAVYRWNQANNKWILISKEGIDTIHFATEELIISEGSVTATNVPTDAKLWDIHVLDGDVIIADPRLEDLTVGGSTISGLTAWNTKKLRFTYAYGSISQQIETYIDYRLGNVYETTFEVVNGNADASQGDYLYTTLNNNTTMSLTLPTINAGQVFSLIFQVDNTADYTIT